MDDLVRAFVKGVSSGDIEIYNEFSLQHELGLFLRRNSAFGKVQFERNISHFNFAKKDFQKREIDVSVIDVQTQKPLIAIELKYPRNGQYPEQMFSFCKDICFIEQLKKAGFQRAFLLILAEDRLFYSGNGEGIYGYFRMKKPLCGPIMKPTGARNEEVCIGGKYKIQWHSVRDAMKYTLIEAQ